MPSLRSINAEAGTNFRRWKQVAPAIKEGEQAKAEVEVMKAAEPVPEAVTMEEAKPMPIPEVDEPMQSVTCAKCGGTLHAEGNYPNLFRCGTCNTVQKLVPGPRLSPPAPEPVPEPTEAEVREARHVRQTLPNFPRKLNDRVAYQMRGRGFTVEDGWPIAGGRGNFTTQDETWKYGEDGHVILVWEHVSWKVQRDSMYEAIIGQPLVRAGDGSVDVSMFTAHHAWIDYLSEYQQKKLDAIKEGVETFAEDRVVWFQDGIPIYQTTIGALLAESLSLRA